MPYSYTTFVNNQAPAINAANLNNMEQGISDLFENLDDFREATMLSTHWNSANKTYDFSTSPHNLSSNTYNLTISVDSTATEAQYNAFAAAKICGSVGSNTIKALGVVPSVDIPIIIKVVTK